MDVDTLSVECSCTLHKFLVVVHDVGLDRVICDTCALALKQGATHRLIGNFVSFA